MSAPDVVSRGREGAYFRGREPGASRNDPGDRHARDCSFLRPAS